LAKNPNKITVTTRFVSHASMVHSSCCGDQQRIFFGALW